MDRQASSSQLIMILQHSLERLTMSLGSSLATLLIDPISSLIIPGEDDGRVSVESTKLDGMSDHIVISATHTFFPSNKIAQHQILKFLESGEFERESPQ